MTSAELLRLAAEKLDEKSDPFAESFLSEHQVTLDQAMSLAEQLAIGARIVAKGIEQPRSHQGVAMLLTMAESL
jgi:hypothetical protein